MQASTLRIPKGQLFFENRNLVISDNVAIIPSRIGLSLLCFAMLAVSVKSLNVAGTSSWLHIVSLFGWLLPAWLLYSIRNTSDAKAIAYSQIKRVKYKKAHYGFRQPVLEVEFINERDILKLRYIHIKDEQLGDLINEFKYNGIQVEV